MITETRDMAQWVSVFAALPEDGSLAPSTVAGSPQWPITLSLDIQRLLQDAEFMLKRPYIMQK